MDPEDFSIAKKAVSLAVISFQTPSWRRLAQKMEGQMKYGHAPDPKDLELVLTVLEQGRSNYTRSVLDLAKQETDPDRITILQAVPLRDRLRKAA